MTTTLSPTPKQQFFDNNGNPADKYRVFVYSGGTSTKATTWTDSTGLTPNANPITLDFRGECNLWLSPNVSYKLVYCAPGSDDPPTTSIWTVDNVVNNQLITLYGGVDTGIADAYILNFTAQFSALTDGIVVYWIPSHNNTGASTINVNSLGIKNIVNLNGSALGANQIVANQITQIIYQAGQWQLLSVGNVTGVNVGTFGTETTIASAATTDLGSALAHVVNVTGTTTITSFGSSAQTVAPIYLVRFTSAVVITYNATSMINPTGVDLYMRAGGSLIAEYLGSGNWRILLSNNYSDSQGSFNGTLTSGGASNTVTMTYRIRSGWVHMWCSSGATVGADASTQLVLTGMPASVIPTVTTAISIPLSGVLNSGSFGTGLNGCIVVSNSASWQFLLDRTDTKPSGVEAGTFPGGFSKGLAGGASFVYAL